jgi:hypothetical protein
LNTSSLQVALAAVVDLMAHTAAHAAAVAVQVVTERLRALALLQDQQSQSQSVQAVQAAAVTPQEIMVLIQHSAALQAQAAVAVALVKQAWAATLALVQAAVQAAAAALTAAAQMLQVVRHLLPDKAMQAEGKVRKAVWVAVAAQVLLEVQVRRQDMFQAAAVQPHLLQVQALLAQVVAVDTTDSVVRVAAVVVLQEMEFQAAMEVQTQVAVQVVRKAQVAEQVDQDLSAFATLILLILQYQQQDRHQ